MYTVETVKALYGRLIEAFDHDPTAGVDLSAAMPKAQSAQLIATGWSPVMCAGMAEATARVLRHYPTLSPAVFEQLDFHAERVLNFPRSVIVTAERVDIAKELVRATVTEDEPGRRAAEERLRSLPEPLAELGVIQIVLLYCGVLVAVAKGE